MSGPAPTPADPAGVRLLVLDVDGVLTDGSILLDGRHPEPKRFDVRDGFAIAQWVRSGRSVAILTGRRSAAVDQRARELGVETVVQGCGEKGAAMREIMAGLGFARDATAAMGDDLPDLPMLREAGYPLAPADAAPEVRARVAHVTNRTGGHGAVREAIEHLLRAQGAWDAIVDRLAGEA